MILPNGVTSFFKMASLVSLGLLVLVACNSSEQHDSLCETHYHAKSYKIAIKHCERAVKEESSSAYYYLGMMYLGDSEKKAEGRKLIQMSAEEGFEQAVFHQTVETILRPADKESADQAMRRMQSYAEAGDDVAQFWMGNIFLFGHAEQKKSPNEANYWYQLAIEQNNLAAMNNLAWIKSLARDSDLFDPEGALHLSKVVTEHYPKAHGYLDTLAAAYAANERYDEAVNVQKRAIKLAGSEHCKSCSEKLIEYYQRHLEFYRAQKPLEEDLFK